MHTNTDQPRSWFPGNGLEPQQIYFYHWIQQRERCRIGRENNLEKPWSDDQILQNYRFCNVRREDDTVTKWIHNQWITCIINPLPKQVVLAMIAARTVNRVETLQEIGYPYYEDTERWFEEARQKMKNRRERGEKVWTGAYLVSTNGHSMDKIDYVIDNVWKPFWHLGRSPLEAETLQSYHKYLMRFDGLGSFMAGQVIADLKYSSLLRNAPDHHSWAPIGPGSKRGLNRYFGRPLEKNIPEKQVAEELLAVQLQVRQRLGLDLAVHNIQNCFCEFDKYLRVKLGEGKPRSAYNGRA